MHCPSHVMPLCLRAASRGTLKELLINEKCLHWLKYYQNEAQLLDVTVLCVPVTFTGGHKGEMLKLLFVRSGSCFKASSCAWSNKEQDRQTLA